MPIEYKKTIAALQDVVTVEEAEGLLEWLQQRRTPRVNLAACAHLHPANLQVLMAVQPKIQSWPEDAELRRWLESALHGS